MYDLILLLTLSILGYKLLLKLISQYHDTFINSGFHGKDLNKPNKPLIPEAQGVLAGCVYLLILYTFLPFLFSSQISSDRLVSHIFKIFKTPTEDEAVYHIFLGKYLAALQSICFMVLLGFADDALDLRWKHKLILPTMATLPLLIAHFILIGNTRVVIPVVIRDILMFDSIDIGFFYYVYMGMLAVFCTNAINIYAGVNGLEVGQSCIISISLLIFNFIEETNNDGHRFSIYFLIPFLMISLAMLKQNWYPAKIFVGDSYCYFAGITFASVGILGHFSKTLLLFFIPQTINFMLSLPQLFKMIPCPRHRLPTLSPNESDQLLIPSTHVVKVESLSSVGKLFLRLSEMIGMCQLKEKSEEVKVVNFTLINLCLVWFGPCREDILTIRLLIFQILCSCLGFVIRYPLAGLLYNQ